MGYSINWLRTGVYVHMEGKVDAVEIGHANNRLYADERFDELDFQVFDMVDAEVILTKDNLIEFSALDTAATRWNEKMKVVLITTSEDLNGLIQKHYATHMRGTGWDVRVMSGRDEAEAWVGMKLRKAAL